MTTAATETFADLVAAEDVLLFVNAAITATGQREFRSEAYRQRLSLDFLHEYVRVNYRRVYAASLALDINDHNAVRVVRGLLEHAGEASPAQKRTEGQLIAARLAKLPPQRVYRLFRELRAAKVNNRRTRAITRDWLAARPDAAHDAVKYRAGLKTAVRHAHLPLDGELGPFLFRPGTLPRYEHRLLDAWRRAHYEQGAVGELPFTVAEGFAARHGMEREAFVERMAPRMTRLERLRTQGQRAAGADGLPADVDLTVMPLTRLALYVLSLDREARVRRRAELTGALRAAARRAAGPHAGSWGRVAAVLDDSYSSSGSGEKRRLSARRGAGLPLPAGGARRARGVHRAVDDRYRRSAARAPVGADAAGHPDHRRAGARTGAAGHRLGRLGQRAAGAGGRGVAGVADEARPGPADGGGACEPRIRRGRF